MIRTQHHYESTSRLTKLTVKVCYSLTAVDVLSHCDWFPLPADGNNVRRYIVSVVKQEKTTTCTTWLMIKSPKIKTTKNEEDSIEASANCCCCCCCSNIHELIINHIITNNTWAVKQYHYESEEEDLAVFQRHKEKSKSPPNQSFWGGETINNIHTRYTKKVCPAAKLSRHQRLIPPYNFIALFA